MICSPEDVAPLSTCFELITPDEAKKLLGKPRDRLSQLAVMVNGLTQFHNGVVPKMPTKATYTDKILESWRKKVETGDA